jgi:hypothetical protein
MGANDKCPSSSSSSSSSSEQAMGTALCFGAFNLFFSLPLFLSFLPFSRRRRRRSSKDGSTFNHLLLLLLLLLQFRCNGHGDNEMLGKQLKVEFTWQ